MLYSVDRIKGDIILLISDDHRKITLNRADCSFIIKEGDILREENGRWQLDLDETDRRRAKVRSLLDSLLEE